MKFPKAFIDTLKDRINISEVVGKSVVLKHKARGEYTGLCPFHNEKTPSFTVSDPKGFYHCFGCGANGTIFNFVMEKRGLDFNEAVKELAETAGIPLPKFDAGDVKREKQMQDSYSILEAATEFFEDRLHSAEGTKALEYLKDRGLSDETIKQFRLGYSPDRSEALFAQLTKLNIDPEMIEANGLCIKSDKNGEYFDRFRGRVMFPIFDQRNRPIAFGGRIMSNSKEVAKYLNSPETDLFKKSYVLYGYNFARDIAFKKQNVAVVEGYMDVIALHQAGIKNVVAPLGTAVTENHMKALWRITKEPVFCLDGDNAGLRAMKKLAEEFITILEPGYSMKFAIQNGSKDPDEVIKNQGVNAMREILMASIPLSEALWRINYNEKEITTPEKKAEFSSKLINLAKNIKNQEVSDFYANYFKTRLNELKFDFRNKQLIPNNNTKLHSSIKSINTKTTDASENLKNTLVLMIYKNPELLQNSKIEHEFGELHLQNNSLSIIHDNIMRLMFEDPAELIHENLKATLEKSGLGNHIKVAESLITRDYFYKEAQNMELLTSVWNYFQLNNNLEQTKKEYINFTSSDEVDFEKAYGLKHEIEILEQKLLEERKNFETLQEKLIGE